jgi:hypothetical protein
MLGPKAIAIGEKPSKVASAKIGSRWPESTRRDLARNIVKKNPVTQCASRNT